MNNGKDLLTKAATPKGKTNQEMIEEFLQSGGIVKKYEVHDDVIEPHKGGLRDVDSIEYDHKGNRVYANLNKLYAHDDDHNLRDFGGEGHE